jgi:hypothetical protein
LTPSLDGTLEAGWTLVPETHGKGFASETLAAMLVWADDNFPDRPVTCIIDPDNAPLCAWPKSSVSCVCASDYHGKTVRMFRLQGPEQPERIASSKRQTRRDIFFQFDDARPKALRLFAVQHLRQARQNANASRWRRTPYVVDAADAAMGQDKARVLAFGVSSKVTSETLSPSGQV